jgi:hypothetical protein
VHSVVMASCGTIYIPSFMYTDADDHATLRFCLRIYLYIPSFIDIGSCIQKLWGGVTHTETERSHKCTFIFSNQGK